MNTSFNKLSNFQNRIEEQANILTKFHFSLILKQADLGPTVLQKW